ncbi:MAG: glycosyltransferase family 2 protein [Vicinamibacteria bacterium]
MAAEMVFVVAALFLFYAYAGYPLLALLAARLRPKGVRKGDEKPTVSVIIVAHDEEAHIAAKIESCLASRYPRELFEILVVSDGSRDRTEEIVRGFETSGVRLLAMHGPNGKPAALNHAVPTARGEVLVLTDARQRVDPEAVAELVANFSDPEVGAVSGELHLETPPGAEPVAGVGAYWKLEKIIRLAESRFDSTVGATGALYALRKSLYRPLDSRLILDDVAVPMDVALSGRRVVFEPKAMVFDRIFEEPSREYRRKVRTLAGNFQLVWLRPELLDPRRNRLFWQLVSHKLSRLAAPWMLVALLLSSMALAADGARFYQLAVALQLALYAFALLGALGMPLRVFSLPYSFLLLNLAAAHALPGFLLGTEKVAWKNRPEDSERSEPGRPPSAASPRAEASNRAKSEGALREARSDEPRGWGPAAPTEERGERASRGGERALRKGGY